MIKISIISLLLILAGCVSNERSIQPSLQVAKENGYNQCSTNDFAILKNKNVVCIHDTFESKCYTAKTSNYLYSNFDSGIFGLNKTFCVAHETKAFHNRVKQIKDKKIEHLCYEYVKSFENNTHNTEKWNREQVLEEAIIQNGYEYVMCIDIYDKILFAKKVESKIDYCKTLGFKIDTNEMSNCTLELVLQDNSMKETRYKEAMDSLTKLSCDLGNEFDCSKGTKSTSFNWTEFAAGLNQLNNSLYGGIGSTSSSKTTCFSTGEYTEGMSKVCQYSCVGSAHAISVGAAQICPLSVQR